MAYTEPYPVITTWPSTTDGYPIGTKRCYHYTLTFDQVTNQRETALDNLIGNSSNSVFMDIVGILTVFGGTTVGIISGAVPIFLDYVNSTQEDAKRALFNIWDAIYHHMIEHGYNRVTISQLISVEAIYGIDLFPEGFPIWAAIAYPRVPDASYYWTV